MDYLKEICQNALNLNLINDDNDFSNEIDLEIDEKVSLLKQSNLSKRYESFVDSTCNETLLDAIFKLREIINRFLENVNQIQCYIQNALDTKSSYVPRQCQRDFVATVNGMLLIFDDIKQFKLIGTEKIRAISNLNLMLSNLDKFTNLIDTTDDIGKKILILNRQLRCIDLL